MADLLRAENPVLWQEMTHQERNAPHWARYEAALGLSIVVILVLYTISTLARIDSPTRETALFMIWLVHACVASRALVAGANAISREHVAMTWDALVLTGVSARRILLGKWLAAIYRVRWWMLALGLIRLAMLPIFVLAFLNRVAYLQGGTYGYSYGYAYANQEMTWIPVATVLAVVMTVVLTILEILACTAIGLAASALLRRGSTASLVAILIRFTPVILFAAFTRYELGPSSYRWWRFTPFALADGGTSPIYQLILPLMPWTQGRHAEALSGLSLAIGVLSIVLVASLAVTLLEIRRTGGLPDAPAPVESPKFRGNIRPQPEFGEE